ncbi:MAG: hypothetical protein KatS3mg012_2476 [Gaiellaceae bacterium]|nr:MAG: hypothetical protein KatS3mg012_2476 [Gaiellaceae bacterium]
MPRVTANGVQLYYEERGTGTPIVGIHGAGSAAVFWEDAAERLAGVGPDGLAADPPSLTPLADRPRTERAGSAARRRLMQT